MGTTPGSAARREVEVQLRGKTFVVKELTLANYGEIENFIKSKYTRLYRESSAGFDPDETHKRIMEILKTDISTEELTDQMDATDVGMFVAYLAIRDNAGIELENYQEQLDTDEVNIIAEAVNGLASDDESTPDVEESEVNPPPPDQENP